MNDIEATFVMLDISFDDLDMSKCLPCMPNRIPSCWKRSGVSFPEGIVMSLALKYWTMRLTRSMSSGNLA